MLKKKTEYTVIRQKKGQYIHTVSGFEYPLPSRDAVFKPSRNTPQAYSAKQSKTITFWINLVYTRNQELMPMLSIIIFLISADIYHCELYFFSRRILRPVNNSACSITQCKLVLFLGLSFRDIQRV